MENEEPDDDESDDDNYERGNAGVQNGDNDEGTSTDSEDDQSSDEEDPKEAAIRKRASTPDYLINHRFKKRVRVARQQFLCWWERLSEESVMKILAKVGEAV